MKEWSQANGTTSLIAHRGFAGLYPENTVAAMEHASSGRDDPTADRVRPDAIEIDVVPSADGDVMVFHDDTLDRLTDAPASLADQFVWETSTERLQELHVLGTTETVPTLREVMDAVPTDVGVNVEFKNPGLAGVRFAELLDRDALDSRTELWTGFAENVLEVIAAYDNEVLVSSFYEGALAAVREIDSRVPVAVLLWDSIQDGLDIAERHDCETLHPPLNMIQGTPFFGEECYDGQEPGTFEDVDLLARARDEDRIVNVWTITTWYQAAQLQGAGVDGIIADYDAVLRFDALGE